MGLTAFAALALLVLVAVVGYVAYRVARMLYRVVRIGYRTGRMAGDAAPDDIAVHTVPTSLRLMRSLAGPFILLATGIGFFAGRLSLTVAALFIAALPAMYSVDIPYGRGAGRNWLRACLILVSSIAIGVILGSQYSNLPTWMVIAGAIYAFLGLPAAALDLALAMNPQLRQKAYERRMQRAGHTRGKLNDRRWALDQYPDDIDASLPRAVHPARLWTLWPDTDPMGRLILEIGVDRAWNEQAPDGYGTLLIRFDRPYRVEWTTGAWTQSTISGAESSKVDARERATLLEEGGFDLRAYQAAGGRDEIPHPSDDESLTRTKVTLMNWSTLYLLHSESIRCVVTNESR